MYYCAYCHLPLDRGWQHWRCLGPEKLWGDPPKIWYYEDERGKFWLAKCRACVARQRKEDVAPMSDDD